MCHKTVGFSSLIRDPRDDRHIRIRFEAFDFQVARIVHRMISIFQSNKFISICIYLRRFYEYGIEWPMK